MRVKTWRVIDRGEVPEGSPTVPFTCRCGREAELPVVGRVIAINGSDEEGDHGIFFDNDQDGKTPAIIQCRKCGHVLANGSVKEAD